MIRPNHPDCRPARAGFIALAWIANELRSLGEGLIAGDVVTTGTCVMPFAIAPGDRIRVDFGDFGSLEATATD